MRRNQWLASVGIAGWFASECPAGIRRITQPGLALLAIETVQQLDSEDRRTRSVWLADRAKCAATSPARMAEIYEDVHGLFGFEVANKEPVAKLEDAVWEKTIARAFEGLMLGEDVAGAKWGDDPEADRRTVEIMQAADHSMQRLEGDEQRRPVLRLGRSLKL